MDDDLHLAKAILALVDALEAGDRTSPGLTPGEADAAWEQRAAAFERARKHADAIINRYNTEEEEEHG